MQRAILCWEKPLGKKGAKTTKAGQTDVLYAPVGSWEKSLGDKGRSQDDTIRFFK